MAKFARNMLFARAISNGARWYCPDLFSGNPVYVPEELGAIVDGEGNVIAAATQPTQIDKTDLPDQVLAWAKPLDAYQWAVSIGGAPNIDAAQAAFSQIVSEHFDGRLTTKNKTSAMMQFYISTLALLEDSQASLEIAQ